MIAQCAISGMGIVIPSGVGQAALRISTPLILGARKRCIDTVPAIEGISRNDVRRMSRLTRFTVCAAHEAMAQSKGQNENSGLFVALTHGSTSLLAEFHDYLFDYGPDMASPNTFSNGVTNAPLSSVSAFLKIKHGGTTLLGREEAGLEALAYCCRAMGDGHYEACCAGASEEYSEIVNSAYDQCGWYGAQLPPYLPFPMKQGDAKTGFGVSEGSAFVVMEPMERCAARGAKALCNFADVDIGSEIPDADVIISGGAAGPQDGFELDMLKEIATKSGASKPALAFSKPLYGEAYALGSMLSCCMAIDMAANETMYPSFPLHPDLHKHFVGEMTKPAKKILVVSCAQNGQKALGYFWK